MSPGLAPAQPRHRVALLVRPRGRTCSVANWQQEIPVVAALQDNLKGRDGLIDGRALVFPIKVGKDFVTEVVAVVYIGSKQPLIQAD